MLRAGNEWRQMSAQAPSRLATSNPSGFFRLRASDSFDVLKDAKNWQRFGPATLSLNGPTKRSWSAGCTVSTRTTVAPWSAKYLAVIGPTPIHEKSAILTPANGSAGGALAGVVTARLGGGSSELTISSACSPTAGACRGNETGVRESFTKAPAARRMRSP